MSRRHRLNAVYGRILRVGLGISLVVHGAVLGFGRLRVETEGTADRALTAVTLADPVPEPEKLEAREAASASDEAAVVAGTAWSPASEIGLTEAEVATAEANLTEYRLVLLSVASADLEAPVVPRPRINPEKVESGLTPIHVRETIRLASANRGRRKRGGGIRVVFGSGDCNTSAATAVLAQLPNRSRLAGLRTAGFRRSF